MKEKIINIPNAITFVRFILIIPFIYFLIYYNRMNALYIFLAFVILDIFDGHIAKSLDQNTEFGKYFDLVSDSIFGIGAFLIMGILGRIPVLIFILGAMSTIITAILMYLGFKKKKDIVSSKNKNSIAFVKFLLVFIVVFNSYTLEVMIISYICIIYMFYQNFTYKKEIDMIKN